MVRFSVSFFSLLAGSLLLVSVGCGGSGSTTTSGAGGSGGDAASSGSMSASGTGGTGTGGTGGGGTGGAGGSSTASTGGAGGTGGSAAMAPVAQINHPGDMEMRPAGMPIPFVGVGNDPQDGALSGASLVWTSDLSGQFGTGEMFNTPLTAGTHIITLTVTDSDSNTGTDSITLYVQ